jgi:ectoine hydroxylase-related dioxygenase (phytanoyl-CoA dioxygenase family)
MRKSFPPASTAPNGADIALALGQRGWCLLEEAATTDMIAAIAQDLDPVFDQTAFCEGGFYGERTKRFGRLLSRSPIAQALVEHPAILAAVDHVLTPWCDTIQLNLTQAIEIHPGALPQLPHRDQDMWRGAKGEMEYLVNVMWPLTPFTAENGATLIYPGSHGARALAEDEPAHGFPVECGPGSAILFLGSTLHGAGGNRTDLPRRGIIVSYCLGWLKPYENQWLAYPPDVARHFSPSLAGLVGYRQHRPNLGNIEGLCPSVLLDGGLPDQIGAIDALRPDQQRLVDDFVACQRAQTGTSHPTGAMAPQGGSA